MGRHRGEPRNEVSWRAFWIVSAYLALVIGLGLAGLLRYHW